MSWALMLSGYALLIAGYYAFRNSTQTLLLPDPNRPTPAIVFNDDKDYVPTETIVVTGHYYMSIAGLSPILSAISGLFWGWVPAALWMILGVTLIGAPTEYMNLLASVRNKGKTMGEMVYDKMGNVSGIYVNLILAFSGILVYSIFVTTMSKTLESIPSAALPTIALIPIALLFGYMKHVMKMSLAKVSLICLAIWTVTIILGPVYLIKLPFMTWMYIFMAYIFLATFLPVWSLLQPRDYLNSAILVVGVSLATLAIIVGRPPIHFPAFVGWITSRGALYPALLATITCGAVNGMHCMISAGMASRQLNNEKNAYPIVAIATRGETVAAILAGLIIMVNYNYQNYLGEVLKNIGGAYSNGFGNIVAYLGIPSYVGVLFGALTLSAFTITTTDSYARAARYSIQELAEKSEFTRKIGLNKPLLSAIVVTLIGFYMAVAIPFMQLWSGFALTAIMLTIYSYFIITLQRKEEGLAPDKGFYLWVVIPGIFMYITTLTALIYFLVKYFKEAQWNPVVIIVILLVCLVLTTSSFFKALRKCPTFARAKEGVISS